jgi:competence protein ComEA
MKKLILFGLLALLISPLTVADQPVNINTADAEALSAAINGVGPSTAEAIVRYREQHGPFASVEDLTRVRGVGERTVAKSRDNLTVGQVRR